MKQSSLTIFLLFYLHIVSAQIGMFSVGGRTTVSLFNDGGTNNLGTGLGGQFRLQFVDRINSDWFFDYLTSDIGTVGTRTDYHIGWNVIYYPYLQKDNYVNFILSKFKPYIVAGHCFDYTQFKANQDPSNFVERWSSAVQAGIGTHVNLSKKLDLTLMSQYMVHLGTHIESRQDGNQLILTEEKGASLEGHLLVTVGLNYKIGKLW
jgi:hypothetical protein